MILITRPIKQAIETQQELKFRGFHSIIYPLLEIHPENFFVDFSKYDAAIITSQNAAEIIYKQINDIPLFLVGEEAASILYGKNIKCVAQDANDVIVKIKEHPYKNYLYLSGDHISTKIDEQLNADRKVIYKSVAVSKFPTEILEQVTCILFYSARTALTFANLIGKYDLSKCKAVCISHKTAEQIKHLNWNEVLVSPIPAQDSLLNLL